MDFSAIGAWFTKLLMGWGLSAGLTQLILNAAGAMLMGLLALLFAGIGLTWLDRKLGARVQDRLGPNRVGKYGLLQPFADMVKLIFKEAITPAGADGVIFNLAPLLAIMAVLGIWAVVPLAPGLIGTDINVGVLYIVSISAVGALSIIMAGWSSNNKYALLGAFRSVAQLVSYEVPLMLTLLVPVMLAGTMSTNAIVTAQSTWYVLLAPVAALIFFISSLAEVGRAPFDLIEAESELAAGYNIEYGGMKFGMFFVAEYLHAYTVAVLTAVLFLGGWRGPGAEAFPLLGVFYLFIKSFLVYFLISLLRFAMPRLRIDHMMAFNWKFLVPLSMVVVILAAVVDKLAISLGWSRMMMHLGSNIVLFLITMGLIGLYARAKRAEVEARTAKPAAVASGG